ncbi:MAG TPA: tetratricopeptide repeat protein, partial [Candidatus Polarisedimenticolia bacterium]|nr:tetratricopeptide repeat protein [Candidatus Polarisedimenticolia bacterium]
LEREPALFEAVPVFADYNHRPLEDSRVTRIVDAARGRLLIDPTLYDVIVVAGMDPWLPQSAALTTVEGLRLLKARLRPGGLLAQRVQLSSTTGPALETILRTFARTFESILLFQTSPEDLLVLGSSEPLALDVGWFKNVFGSSPSVAQDVARVLPLNINGVLLEFRLGGDALRGLLDGGPLNDDGHAPVEVASYRQLRVHDNSVLLTRIDNAWTGLGPFLRNAGGTKKEKAEFLYNVAKSYLGAAADPGRARGIAQELAGIGRAAMARWVTGECLIQEKDIDGALGEWQAVLDLEPHNLDALFSLGTFYLDSNDYRRAETYLSHAARLYPDTPVVRYTRGRNLYLLGRYKEAIPELQKARDLPGGKDQYPVIDYILGASELQVGQVKDASAALEAYLKWATTQPVLTRLDVDAHLKLAQAYERLGKRFLAHQEREKGDKLLKKIQASGQGSAVAAPSTVAPSAPTTAGPRTPRHGQP